MTIVTDALSRAVTYDVDVEIDPTDRRIHRELEERCDCPYQNATLDRTDEVQTITPGNRTGGTFDLTFTIDQSTINGGTATVSLTGLVFNVTASALQTALDAQAVIDGANLRIPYVAGDIAVTGGPVGTSDTIFTYSGESVAGNQPLVVGTYTSLTGGTTDPAESETTAGVPPRYWFAALKLMGVISGTDPAFGDAPAGQYTVTRRDQIENYPSNQTIRALIKEASVVEGQDWEGELLPLLGLE